jgi:hypothetical protein
MMRVVPAYAGERYFSSSLTLAVLWCWRRVTEFASCILLNFMCVFIVYLLRRKKNRNMGSFNVKKINTGKATRKKMAEGGGDLQ